VAVMGIRICDVGRTAIVFLKEKVAREKKHYQSRN
jgi:hypothetical protein